MRVSMMNHTGMSNSAHNEQHDDFNHSAWGDMNDFQTSQQDASIDEFDDFQFGSSPNESMDPAPGTLDHMEPPVTTFESSELRSTQQLLPMMRTNSKHNSPLAPAAVLTKATIASMPSKPVIHSSNHQRRTLSDDDRRRMCLYHDENPTVKQTEIGSMFGVERSTVSKVLRNREKYLNPDDGNKLPLKKLKGKFPDIEKALSNWARNAHRQGVQVTDAMIKEKARFFATTVGSTDSHSKINDMSWIEKFRQRNDLNGNKRSRKSMKRAKREPTPDNTTLSRAASHGIINSPAMRSSPAITVAESGANMKASSPESIIGFGQASFPMSASHSTTSLSGQFSDGHSAFISQSMSPDSPYVSPSQQQAANNYFLTQRLPLPSTYSRPRSQTFPMLGIEAPTMPNPMTDASATKYTDIFTPKGTVQSPSYSSSMAYGETHGNALATAHGLPHNGLLSSPIIHQQMNDSSSMPPPKLIQNQMHHYKHCLPQTSVHSPLIGLPSSPTPEDARQALELVMQFIQHQPHFDVDQKESLILSKLVERLGLRSKTQEPGFGCIPESGEIRAQ